MIRRIIPIALALAAFATSPAHSWLAQKSASVTSSSQVLSTNATGSFSNSAVRYLPVGYSAVPKTTNDDYAIITAPGNITSIRFWVSVPPTGIQTWTAELFKNGSGTGLTCPINSGSGGKCSASGSVSFVAGDRAKWAITPANSPTSIAVGSLSAVFAPTTANDTIITGRAVATSNSATHASQPFSDQGAGVPASRNLAYIPDDGILDKLYVVTNAPSASADGKKYNWAVIKNAVTASPAVNCDILETATSCNDTTNSLSVTGPSGATAGDYIQFIAAPTNTPTAATGPYGARYRPTCAGTPGCFPLMSVFPVVASTTVPTYYPLSGGTTAGSLTETSMQSITDSMTITKIAVRLNAAPGAGKSRVYTVRVNAADTACTVTVADTALFNSATCSLTVANDDLVTTSDVPAGTPAAATPNISLLANR